MGRGIVFLGIAGVATTVGAYFAWKLLWGSGAKGGAGGEDAAAAPTSQQRSPRRKKKSKFRHRDSVAHVWRGGAANEEDGDDVAESAPAGADQGGDEPEEDDMPPPPTLRHADSIAVTRYRRQRKLEEREKGAAESPLRTLKTPSEEDGDYDTPPKPRQSSGSDRS